MGPRNARSFHHRLAADRLIQQGDLTNVHTVSRVDKALPETWPPSSALVGCNCTALTSEIVPSEQLLGWTVICWNSRLLGFRLDVSLRTVAKAAAQAFVAHFIARQLCAYTGCVSSCTCRVDSAATRSARSSGR